LYRLRGGSFEAKLELCFAVADVDEVRRLSEQQAAAFFSQDASVVACAAARAAGEVHANVDWAVHVVGLHKVNRLQLTLSLKAPGFNP
jgi:hypothetical protein